MARNMIMGVVVCGVMSVTGTRASGFDGEAEPAWFRDRAGIQATIRRLEKIEGLAHRLFAYDPSTRRARAGIILATEHERPSWSMSPRSLKLLEILHDSMRDPKRYPGIGESLSHPREIAYELLSHSLHSADTGDVEEMRRSTLDLLSARLNQMFARITQARATAAGILATAPRTAKRRDLEELAWAMERLESLGREVEAIVGYDPQANTVQRGLVAQPGLFFGRSFVTDVNTTQLLRNLSEQAGEARLKTIAGTEPPLREELVQLDGHAVSSTWDRFDAYSPEDLADERKAYQAFGNKIHRLSRRNRLFLHWLGLVKQMLETNGFPEEPSAGAVASVESEAGADAPTTSGGPGGGGGGTLTIPGPMTILGIHNGGYAPPSCESAAPPDEVAPVGRDSGPGETVDPSPVPACATPPDVAAWQNTNRRKLELVLRISLGSVSPAGGVISLTMAVERMANEVTVVRFR